MAEAKHVLFEDDLFRYQLITSKYLDEAISVVMNGVFTEGSMSKCLGSPDDPEAMKELEAFSRSLVDDGISVICIDKKKDKVTGIIFNKLFIKGEPFYENYANSFKNFKARQMIDMRHNMLYLVNLFETLEATCLMEIVLLGILPEYRKNGIAKKLCEIAVDIAQKLHDGVNIKRSINNEELPLEARPEGVAVMFSSFISQKIGRDLNFTVAAEHPNERWEALGEVLINKNIVTKNTTLEYLKLK